MMIQNLKKINSAWFFTELPFYLKFLLLYVKGDLIVLFPLSIAILLLGFFSLKFMTLMIGFYIAIRHLGEMMYWFSHQFYDRKYRPPDFGFKNLDNHAIYIFYQTLSIAWIMFGIFIVCAVLLYWK
jgi:hypothetical protein